MIININETIKKTCSYSFLRIFRTIFLYFFYRFFSTSKPWFRILVINIRVLVMDMNRQAGGYVRREF